MVTVIAILFTALWLENDEKKELIQKAEEFIAPTTQAVSANISSHENYAALRKNLPRICAFWYWMHYIMPIEGHSIEYYLVASCLEGEGTYHARSGNNPTKSFVKYRDLLTKLSRSKSNPIRN